MTRAMGLKRMINCNEGVPDDIKYKMVLDTPSQMIEVRLAA